MTVLPLGCYPFPDRLKQTTFSKLTGSVIPLGLIVCTHNKWWNRKNRKCRGQHTLLFLFVTEHCKYKIMAPTENSMALRIKKMAHFFSTSGTVEPTHSVAFLGTGYMNMCSGIHYLLIIIYTGKWEWFICMYEHVPCWLLFLQESENGLYVCMNTFLGLGRKHVEWYHRKTGNAVFLNIKRTRKEVRFYYFSFLEHRCS